MPKPGYVTITISAKLVVCLYHMAVEPSGFPLTDERVGWLITLAEL